MSDRWIITSHNYHQHTTLKAAHKERARLTEKTGKKFVILRVKRWLTASEQAERLAELERRNAELVEVLKLIRCSHLSDREAAVLLDDTLAKHTRADETAAMDEHAPTVGEMVP